MTSVDPSYHFMSFFWAYFYHCEFFGSKGCMFCLKLVIKYTNPFHKNQQWYDRKLAPQSVRPMPHGYMGFCTLRSSVCTALRQCHECQWSSMHGFSDKWKYPCRRQPWNLSREGELATQRGIAFPGRLLGVSRTYMCFQWTVRNSPFASFSVWP